MTERRDASGTFVVDAFESSDLAVLESDGGARVLVPRSWLPAVAREGHVLRIAPSDGGGRMTLSIEVDEAATEERRNAMRERLDRLPKGPAGDLDL